MFFVAGCATTPPAITPDGAAVSFSKFSSEFGQWRGSGKVTRIVPTANGSRRESWSLSVEIVARTPGYGRIEITGSMGVYGGTVAWTPQGTRLLLPAQQKFIFSETSRAAFRSVLPVDLSPLWLERVAFRQEFAARDMAAAGYECEVNSGVELVETCRSQSGSITRRYGRDGKIFLSASAQKSATESGSVELELAEVRSKVQERPALWSLEPPRGFKVTGSAASPKSTL